MTIKQTVSILGNRLLNRFHRFNTLALDRRTYLCQRRNTLTGDAYDQANSGLAFENEFQVRVGAL